jgi:hypothetical protein
MLMKLPFFVNTKEFVEDINGYCDELEDYYLNRELQCVCAAVRAGIDTQLPCAALSLTRWDELEEMVCGRPEIDVDLLRSMTDYERGCSASDPHIVWLWELLKSEFTHEDKKAFVRFCWGRSRLPLNKATFTQQFKIQPYRPNGPPDNYCPVSHTCFFSIEIPR